MLSKLCKSSFVGLKQLHQINNKFLFQNIQHFKILPNQSRLISTDNDYTSPVDNLFDIPNLPEPISDIVLNTIGEPSFASIGLNNYTPSGLIQFILENVHNHLGLPWWACIITTSVLMKTLLVPVILNQKRALVTYQTNMQNSTRILTEAIDARKSGNSLLMYEVIKRFNDYQGQLKNTTLNILKPIFIQVPVFITVFFALKGMANAPVASLATGGLWWFTDLTVGDPFYILPLITVGSIALMVELGVEFPNHQAKQLKFILRCIAPVTFIFMCQFPSTLLLYWSCSNIYSLLFAQIMKIPKVKKAINIEEFNRDPTVHNPNNYGFKETMEIINSLSEVLIREREANQRWSKDQQTKILDEGLAAAAVRKKMKESMMKRDKSTLDVVGEIVEEKNKENKI